MKEVIQLVTDLNSEFYEKTHNAEWIPFDFNTDGTEYRIMFLGSSVFSSASDSLNKEKNQTLENFVRIKVSEMMDEIDTFSYYFKQ